MTLGLVPEERIPGIVRFYVPGEPVSKARARLRVSRTGRVSSYTPDTTAAAERAVALIGRAAGLRPSDRWDYHVTIVFRLSTWVRRDIDNLGKLVLDGLNGIAWEDDSQVRSLSLTLERGVSRADAGTWVSVAAIPAQRKGRR